MFPFEVHYLVGLFLAGEDSSRVRMRAIMAIMAGVGLLIESSSLAEEGALRPAAVEAEEAARPDASGRFFFGVCCFGTASRLVSLLLATVTADLASGSSEQHVYFQVQKRRLTQLRLKIFSTKRKLAFEKRKYTAVGRFSTTRESGKVVIKLIQSLH